MPSAMIAELRPASFRGVPFEVSSTSLKVGRRVQVFEYPQRDVPFVEDLGKSARTVTLQAYIAGADYIARMKNLIAACEAEGSGTLIDPWLGRMTVTPRELSAPVFDSVGVAKITLTFVECGALKFPDAQLDARALCLSAADALKDAVIADFVSRFDISTSLDFVKSAVAANIVNALDTAPMRMFARAVGLVQNLEDLIEDVPALINSGATALCGGVVDALGLAGVASQTNAWAGISQRIGSIIESDVLTTVVMPATVSVADTAIATATNAANSMIRGVLASNLPGIASNIGTERDRISEELTATVMAYDELISVRDAVLDTIDAECLRVNSDAVYQALADSRVAIHQELTNRADSRARLVTLDITEPKPSLVLAYDHYGDARREAEIVGRNGVRNGTFVPAGKVKMLNA